MKNIILIAFLLVSFLAKSQSITEKLGAVKTDFKISSAAQKMDVLDQLIVKRNITTFTKAIDNYKIQEKYFFQFICKNELVRKQRGEIKREVLNKQVLDFRSNRYYVRFFDENDKSIYEFIKEQKGIFNEYYNLGSVGYYVYSFSLDDLPFILFDQVKNMDVQIID
jgi:hypothetical protein